MVELYPPGLNHAALHESTGDMPLPDIDISLDTLVLKGRFATMSLAGDYIDLDEDYEYVDLMAIRAQKTAWTLARNEFHILYTRLSASVSGPLSNSTQMGVLGGVHFVSRAEEGVDLFLLEGGRFEVHPRGGGQTINWIRGAEVVISSGAVSDPTVNVERVRVLNLENQMTTGVAPTIDNVLLWFETDSASAAAVANLHEIRLRSNNRIFSGVGAPNNAVEPFASAPIGSVYLRSDPADADTVLYVKHDTTWTALIST